MDPLQNTLKNLRLLKMSTSYILFYYSRGLGESRLSKGKSGGFPVYEVATEKGIAQSKTYIFSTKEE